MVVFSRHPGFVNFLKSYGVVYDLAKDGSSKFTTVNLREKNQKVVKNSVKGGFEDATQ